MNAQSEGGPARDLTVLQRLARRLNANADPAFVYREAVDSVVDLIDGAGASSLWLVDTSTQTARPVAWRGHEESVMSSAELRADESLLGKTLGSSGPVRIPESARDPAFRPIQSPLDQIRSVIGAALRAPDGEVLGALFADSYLRASAFTEEDAALLQAIAEQISVVLQRHRLLEEQKHLVSRLQAAHETERGQIARFVHDELGSLSTVIHLTLNAASVTGLSPQQATQLAESARDLVGKVRAVSSQLRPPVLDDIGLIAALEVLVEQCRRACPMQISVVCQPEIDRLTDPHASAVYRVVQEALTNAMRHSGAAHMAIEVGLEGHFLEVVMRDDGIGFEPVLEEYSGLQYMRDRIHVLGGEVNVVSAPGKGTSILATIPRKRKPAGSTENSDGFRKQTGRRR